MSKKTETLHLQIWVYLPAQVKADTRISALVDIIQQKFQFFHLHEDVTCLWFSIMLHQIGNNIVNQLQEVVLLLLLVIPALHVLPLLSDLTSQMSVVRNKISSLICNFSPYLIWHKSYTHYSYWITTQLMSWRGATQAQSKWSVKIGVLKYSISYLSSVIHTGYSIIRNKQ